MVPGAGEQGQHFGARAGLCSTTELPGILPQVRIAYSKLTWPLLMSWELSTRLPTHSPLPSYTSR